MAESVEVQATWIAQRAERLQWYTPTSFLRQVPVEMQQLAYGTGAATRFGKQPHEEVLPMVGVDGQWLLQLLPWDTEFFGTTTYRLFTGLFPDISPVTLLAQAATALRVQLTMRGPFYAFTVVPAEDITLLQALTSGGWQLVETRLNYHRSTNEPLPIPSAPVRLAEPAESAHIGKISAMARNEFDRFHADPWFGPERAAAMLARYAEAAVVGNYADAVLVPNESGLPVDSFIAIGDTPVDPTQPGSGSSRVLLTAVGPQNRGWHLKLVAETIRRAASLGLPQVFMTTQSTNRAVFRTCEKLGFRLGSTFHVLACHG
jgi:dTDP-4-amino-4,6-dideoxy-D-galactose acyltransferase